MDAFEAENNEDGGLEIVLFIQDLRKKECNRDWEKIVIVITNGLYNRNVRIQVRNDVISYIKQEIQKKIAQDVHSSGCKNIRVNNFFRNVELLAHICSSN